MILRVFAVLLACLISGLAYLGWQLSRGPLSVASFIPSLEEAIRGTGGEWRIDIGDLVLMSDLRLHARAVDLIDANGTPVLHVPDVVVRPSLRALLHGMVAISAVEVSGAEAKIRLGAGGTFSFAVAGAATAPAAGGAGSEFLEELLGLPRSDRPIGFLHRFRIVDARVRIEDEKGNLAWVVDQAQIGLVRSPEGHQVTGRAALAADERGGEATDLDVQLSARPNGEGFTLEGQARASALGVSRLGLYWPLGVAEGGRLWVTERIQKGRVSAVTANISLQSDQGVAMVLKRLDGSFAYEGLEVRWLATSPPVTAIAGRATFDRTGMQFDVRSAMSDKIRIGATRVDLKGFDDGKLRVKIKATGNGPLADMLAIVPERSGDPRLAQVTGDGSLSVDAAFPLRGGFSFADVDLLVHVEPKSVRIRRPDLEAVVSGRLRYHKPPARPSTLVGDLTVQQGRIDSGPVKWKQPAHEDGEVGFQVNLQTDDWRIDPLRVDLPGLKGSGTAVISTGDGPISVNLRNVVHADTRLDALAGKWGRRGIVARLGRGTLDLAPLLDDSGGDGAQAGDAAGDSGGPDLDITAPGLTRVGFDADSWLENVDATIVRQGGEWRTVLLNGDLPKPLWSSASGAANDRKRLTIRLEPTGPARRLEAKADDFGALMRAVNLSNGVRGGTLVVSGRADDSGRDTRLRAHIKATSFVIKDAPLFLRILTVAAPAKYIGTVRGDGLQFDSLKGILVVKGGRYELQDFRAHGNSLGWTARGWIDTNTNRLSINGALIPAHAASKILKGIPVVGGWLTGRDRTGFVAISYKIEGDTRQPQITSNPLTALTPGVLREVWELSPGE
jgi:hypothetical protein